MSQMDSKMIDLLQRKVVDVENHAKYWKILSLKMEERRDVLEAQMKGATQRARSLLEAKDHWRSRALKAEEFNRVKSTVDVKAPYLRTHDKDGGPICYCPRCGNSMERSTADPAKWECLNFQCIKSEEPFPDLSPKSTVDEPDKPDCSCVRWTKAPHPLTTEVQPGECILYGRWCDGRAIAKLGCKECGGNGYRMKDRTKPRPDCPCIRSLFTSIPLTTCTEDEILLHGKWLGASVYAKKKCQNCGGTGYRRKVEGSAHIAEQVGEPAQTKPQASTVDKTIRVILHGYSVCAKCRAAMIPWNSYYLRHPADEQCPNGGKLFELPVIEIEEIPE